MENVTEDLGEETQWGKIIFEKIIHVYLFVSRVGWVPRFATVPPFA